MIPNKKSRTVNIAFIFVKLDDESNANYNCCDHADKVQSTL